MAWPSMAWHGMGRSYMINYKQYDGMAQHGMEWDNMILITSQHDGMAQHDMAWNGTI